MNTADMIKIDNELSQRPVEFFGTREQWEALTSAQQAHYRKVNFRGDSGGGGGTGSPNFVGTTAEWNALSASEKAEFDSSKGVTVNIKDDDEEDSTYHYTNTDATTGLITYIMAKNGVVTVTFDYVPCQTTGQNSIDVSSILGIYKPYYKVFAMGIQSGSSDYSDVRLYRLDDSGVLSYYVYTAGSVGCVTFTYVIG